jgi:hypothetical protein
MANVDAAFGLVPVRHMSGNIPRANKYTIASGLAENIFTGDLVILINTGLLTPHTATETNNIGVFAGVSYTASDGSFVYSQYWPSGTTATDIIAYVYDDPYIVYKKFSPQELPPRQTLVIVLMLLQVQVRQRLVNQVLKFLVQWQQVLPLVKLLVFMSHQIMLSEPTLSWKC